MASSFVPWEYYPSLTAKRLSVVAAHLQETRNRVIELSYPDEGDSSWSIGCRVYDRTIFRLKEASITSDWLRVLPETHRLRLTFAIGSVPIKLYRGEPDEIPARSLVRSFSELRQMRLAFEQEGADVNLSMRIAVETDLAGRTTTVSLVEVNDAGEPVRVYEIPLVGTNILPMKSAPIDLAPPKLELITTNIKEPEVANDDHARTAGGKP